MAAACCRPSSTSGPAASAPTRFSAAFGISRAVSASTRPRAAAVLRVPPLSLRELRATSRPGERLLIPYMGPVSAAVGAVFRGLGVAVEALPPPDGGTLAAWPALAQVVSGRLFGLAPLLARAARAFSALAQPRDLPLVEVAGEIYVRSVGFSNDDLVERLEAHGLRAFVSPVSEWTKYSRHMAARLPGKSGWSTRVSAAIQGRIEQAAWNAIGPALGWPRPVSSSESLAAARPYLSDRLEGEAVLTLGSPLHAWRGGQIDAVVSVGPLECMPTKIAEAQFHHAAEREGLPCLTVSFNGEPLAGSVIADFAFDVHQRARGGSGPGRSAGRR